MNTKLIAAILAASLLTVSCAKKEQEASKPAAAKADPHAGMDMSGKDPHAGMDVTGKDPHAGMSGMMQSADAQANPAVIEGVLSVEGLTGKVPSEWTSTPPTMPMRLAQFKLPAAKGDAEPGEISVFFLGPAAGGVEANIQRWFGQFSQPDGEPTAEVAKRESLTVNGMKATVVSFPGVMTGSGMPGMGGSRERQGWMNLSAIVETPNGPVFFKGTGPEKTMKAQEGTLKEFLKGLKFTQ